MGKGDKKTRRGKIIMGSHGVTRPKRIRKTTPLAVAAKPEPVADEPKAKPKAAPKVVAKDAEAKPKAVKKTKATAKTDEPAASGD
ncbi:30S ribosomal protein THX [Lentimicrobium sp.]|jgi:ribosomal small subunit protein bTHX|uniref:30S ribosomal protein THX n=1 Tax=Lentimicrobium sp. TaxID=2034841 RepID=UPI0025E7D16F|nr:30S ribosomal protein THX [Lentimicrobium sp.]MCO5256325.1 30S ribosomal protein THX [Lentimicrobium sp.]HPF65393.1 30S ribosomal protein THX [Lentimicrobium sp.]HPJ62960.1 30S ribosomal protein THX [Lentimicrobium sp.]HPR26714.1 30S ribosomal protein THX [Lentimicrobium sp.]HRW69907.1 30S ribosomal protein THX [Lentimicrobium sp.]